MFSPFPWDKEGQLNCRIIICQNYLTYIGTSENQQHDHEYKWRVIHCIFVWVCKIWHKKHKFPIKKTIFAQISRGMNDKIVPREDQKTAN